MVFAPLALAVPRYPLAWHEGEWSVVLVALVLAFGVSMIFVLWV